MRLNYKKAIAAFILILFFPAIIIVSYFCSFKIIKAIDLNIFNLYASDGFSTTNPYLNNEVLKNTIIADAVTQVFGKTEKKFTTTQEAYKFLLDNKENANRILLQNHEYKKYMDDNGLSINGFWNFAEKMGKLDENIINAIIYIWLLIYVLIFYFFFGYRKGIFITVFLIYTLTVINSYSDGLLSYALYRPFTNFIAIFNTEALSLNEHLMMFNSFFPTLKEAILTYILLDTAYQIAVDRKYKKNVFLFREILYSLKIMKHTLIKNKGGNFYITKLHINFYPLIYVLKRKRKRDSNSNELFNLMTSIQNRKFSYKPDELFLIVTKMICLIEQNKHLISYVK